VIRIIHTKHRFQILSSMQSCPFMKIWVTKDYLKNAWVVLLKIIMRVLTTWFRVSIKKQHQVKL